MPAMSAALALSREKIWPTATSQVADQLLGFLPLLIGHIRSPSTQVFLRLLGRSRAQAAALATGPDYTAAEEGSGTSASGR